MPDQKTYNRFTLLLAAAVFMLVGIISATLFREGRYSQKDAQKFEKVLHKKEQLLKDEFNVLAKLAPEETISKLLDKSTAEYQELATREGLYIFYYDNGVIKYWSDQSVPLPDHWRARLNRPFLSLRNADYVSVIQPVQGGLLVGLIEVKTHYPLQNEFLINGFQHDFRLDPGVEVEFFEADGTDPIFNEAGDYLFSLDFSGTEPNYKGLRALAVISLLVSLLLFFAGSCSVLKNSKGRRRWIWLGAITILILGSVVAVLRFSFPSVLTQSVLFQPEIFASRLFPSLGALLVYSIAALLLGGFYYLFGNLEGIRSELWKRLVATLLFVVSALLLLVIDQLIRTLVLDSSISFEAHRVTTLSGNSVIGLITVLLWFLLLGLVMDKAIVLLSGSAVRAILYGTVTISLTFLAASLFPVTQSSWIGWIALMLFLAGHIYIRLKQEERIPFSRFIFLLFFVSLFMTIRLQESNRVHVERKREVELVKLSSEHDPVGG